MEDHSKNKLSDPTTPTEEADSPMPHPWGWQLLLRPAKYTLAFLLIGYLVAYPKVLGALRCDEAVTARESHVPEIAKAVLAGMTRFHGHLFNIDTNKLHFSICTSHDEDTYFSVVEKGLETSGWEIVDGLGESRTYQNSKWGRDSLLKVTYFNGCEVDVFFANHFPCEVNSLRGSAAIADDSSPPIISSG